MVRRYFINKIRIKDKKCFIFKNIIWDKIIELEIKESLFVKRFFKNRVKLNLFYEYFVYRYKKLFKKRIVYFRKKKRNNFFFLRKKLVFYLIYKKWKRKKYIKLKYLYLNLCNKKKRYLYKDKKIEYIKKMFDKYFINKRCFKRFIRRCKRLFRCKYFLMKKFKRLKIKKIRIGILYFRSYYFNYYVMLIDLLYNVICLFFVGLVSEFNNKKIKMLKVVVMLIFFCIL